LFQTSRLDASINVALEAATGDDEVVLVDADTYGGAVA
jgi:Mrp family chromosome partitioning ATPase